MSRLDIKRKLSSRSDRVKSTDLHPTEPWLLTSLYNGQVHIWDYTKQELLKSFEITELPVRSAKFIARKQWVLTGADDMQLRVHNYNTLEKVKALEAHTDYIRCVAVHPTLPVVLSSSDDMLIKLWDWEKGWTNTMVFEGHGHYVMQVCFNPKDTNTFASASLDRTVKVWGLGQAQAHFTLEGHDRGVNAVDYYVGGEKPYLLSGSDDRLVKVWDYQTKTCVATLEGHQNNVSAVAFHAPLNLIVTGSEDSSLRLWSANTYRLEKTLNYGMERAWSVALLKGSNRLAAGFDEGCVVLKLASEAPAASLDETGKVLWARQHEVFQANVLATATPADGERLPLQLRELGTSEFHPARLQHDRHGRYAAVCGDGEYVIYTALAWRNKAHGQALELAWGLETGQYATRDAAGKVRLFQNFKEARTLRLPFSAEAIFGGALLAVRGSGFVCLCEWAEGRLVRRIDVAPSVAEWSESGDLLALGTPGALYVLRFARDAVVARLAPGTEPPDDGFEDAFAVDAELPDRVRSGRWVGDCFVFVSATNKLNYCVGGEVSTVAHLDRKLYLLGYLVREQRLYLIDKQHNVCSYGLHLGVVNFQTLVLRGELDAAQQLLGGIPREQHQRLAQFLEARGEKERALAVSPDAEYRLELALQLGRTELAEELAAALPASPARWRQLASLALAAGRLALASRALRRAGDLPGLLLLHTATADAAQLVPLAELAAEGGLANVAFACALLQGRPETCLDALVAAGRVPEAAFMARTYLPSQLSMLVKLWREELARTNAKAAEALADPADYPNMFPDLEVATQLESHLRTNFFRRCPLPATAATAVKDLLARDLLAEFKRAGAVELPVMGDKPVAEKPSAAAAAAVSSTTTPTPTKPDPQPQPTLSPAPQPTLSPAPQSSPSTQAASPAPSNSTSNATNPASFFTSLLTTPPVPPPASKPTAVLIDFDAVAPATPPATSAATNRSIDDELADWESESFK